jgi:putative membrane-bound dehydrogenase-like protein
MHSKIPSFRDHYFRCSLPIAAFALLALSAGGFPASAQVPEDSASDGQIIRQGGYVERVDPNVDYRDRLPRLEPREPEQSLEAFQLAPGFRLELVAAEPLIADAVDLAFDERGRLFVAEMIPYAEGGSSEFGSPNGRVSRLEDTDGDGRFDHRTVYVSGLVWPTGIACFDGGVFVASAPELLYCKDLDGDGTADSRTVVLDGFELSNPNALPNSLRWGLDHRLHGMTSTAGGELVARLWETTSGQDVPAIQARGRDFSIHPRTGQLQLESGGGQFGMTFDAWGRKFESSNSAPCEMVMYEDRYLARNPFLAAPAPRVNIWKGGPAVFRTSPAEPWRVIRTEMRVSGVFSGPVEGGGKPAGYFTAACGLTVYEGDAWPAEVRGNGFVCEGSGNLVVRMRLDPQGVGCIADRVHSSREFLTSDEVWFRPIQFAHGPDGNLYLADMYRECFEHPDAVPPSVKKYLDLTTGNDRGRVYRIVHEGTPRRPHQDLGALSVTALVDLLEHANVWHRNTAGRLLYERQDREAVEPLQRLASESASPLGRMHAMYALHGLDELTAATVLAGLEDEHPRVREHAVRLAESVLEDAPAVRSRLFALHQDPDPRVRYQLAFTLGEIGGPQASEALAAILRQDPDDPWMRLAVLSSCLGRAGELFSLLAEDAAWRSTPAARGVLAELAQQAGLQNRSGQVADVLATLESFPDHERPLSSAVVRGLSEGLARAKSPLLAKLDASGGSRAGQLLAEMLERSQQLALDETAASEKRVDAVRSLVTAPYQIASRVLSAVLEARQPQDVQVAAVQTLNRFREPGVAEILVEAWHGLSPKVRSEAAEALCARPERLTALLKALEDQTIQPSQLDPQRIQLLRTHPLPAIRDQAETLLGGVRLARREEAVALYRDALDLKADRERGKAIFKRECSQCHQLEGVGIDLGLPLQAIRNRGREGILLNVLDPNRELNPAYANYILQTDDGLSVTGMIAAETATSLTLKRAEGESTTVLRTNIDLLRNTGLSIMPEGIEKLLTRQEMADLIEYLMTVP